MNMEERRKARLVQVREQEKHFARQVRERVRDKRETERRVLKEHVNAALADAHETELRELESKYLSRVDSVGQGHRDAQQINEVWVNGFVVIEVCIYSDKLLISSSVLPY